MTHTFLDIHALAAQTYGRVYRLALLVAGDTVRAADTTVAAFASLDVHAGDPELALARGLVSARSHQRARPSWKPAALDVERSGLAPSLVPNLLAALWQAPPAVRLAFGLHTLWGLAPEEATTAAGMPLDDLLALRGELAVALGVVAGDAERGELLAISKLLAGVLGPDEAAAVRGRLLADAGARSLRDGLMLAEQMVRQTLPALLAAPPPDGLLERIDAVLVQSASSNGGEPRRWGSFSPKAKLTAAVLLLICALLVAQVLWQRSPGGSGAGTTASQRSPAELIEAAIHRFDRPALEAGALHEVYRGTLDGESWRQERWYEFDAPNRLSVQVVDDENDATLYALVSNGTGSVQVRQQSNRRGGDRLRGIAATLEPEELRAALPILRQQPDMTFFGMGTPPDLGRIYLAQARTAALSSLGATTFLGRSAALLAYTTDRVLPIFSSNETAVQRGQVLLTIDLATSSLLDVTVLPVGAAEGAALHPWRAEVFEVMERAPDRAFVVPQAESSERTSLPNPRAPFFDGGIISLEAALGGAAAPIYVPEELPAPEMRGVVLNRVGAGDTPLLLYEGEFQSVAVVMSRGGNSELTLDGPTRTAGSFSYQVGRFGQEQQPISVAQVRAGEGGAALLQIYLLDQFATAEERAVSLERMVASLQPLTIENLDQLGRPFYRPAAAGGGIEG